MDEDYPGKSVMHLVRFLGFTMFFDKYAEGPIDDYIQNAVWSGDFSTDKAYDILLNLAKKKRVDIVDKDDFDYDRFFHDLYKSTEKGLS